MPFPRETPNVSEPTIQKTNSYEVKYKATNLKHNVIYQLNSLYAVFSSFSEARSFSIDYSINAGNVPKEVSGQLHVRIEKESEI